MPSTEKVVPTVGTPTRVQRESRHRERSGPDPLREEHQGLSATYGKGTRRAWGLDMDWLIPAVEGNRDTAAACVGELLFDPERLSCRSDTQRASNRRGPFYHLRTESLHPRSCDLISARKQLGTWHLDFGGDG